MDTAALPEEELLRPPGEEDYSVQSLLNSGYHMHYVFCSIAYYRFSQYSAVLLLMIEHDVFRFKKCEQHTTLRPGKLDLLFRVSHLLDLQAGRR